MTSTATSFYVTGGTLRLDALSYVERKADRNLLEGLRASEFCYVLTSRQMGKSSLMVRTANKLRERGIHVVVLDLSAVGQNVTREQWYTGLLSSMGEQLQMEDELDDFWEEHQAINPVQRWFNAVAKIVLVQLPGPVVIFIDEIDVVRSLPFSTDEFFAAIRECYNRRARDAEFNRLTFCLLGVATPSDLVRNTDITPFNIGRRIDLDDFTEAEAKPLAGGLHTEPARAAKLLDRVLHWTSGHPYLTQRLCHALASDVRVKGRRDVDRQCNELFLNSRARERDDNLIFVRDRILRSGMDLSALLELYLKAWKHEPILADETSPQVSILRLSGIVRMVDRGLIERNRIYHHVFDPAWVKTNLPDAELRRQQAAFRRGVRTTAIAAVVIIALGIMILIATDRAREARKTLAEYYFSQAQARRANGSAGQRFDSLNALKLASPNFVDQADLRNEFVSCLALLDLKKNTNRYRPPEGSGVYELNPDRQVGALAGPDGTVAIQSLEDGKLIKPLPGLGSPVTRLRFGHDSAILLAEYQNASTTQTVVWNWPEAKPLFTVPYASHSEAVDFSHDGKKLALSKTDGELTVYSLPGGEILYQRKLRLASRLPRICQVVRFAPSGDFLAESCLDDLYVQIWDLRDRKIPPIRLFHPDRVNDLSWHPAGELLAAGCDDSRIYLWDVHHPERAIKLLTGHERGVTALAFNGQGTMLASTARDETIRLWSPAAGERHVTDRLNKESFDRLRFSATGDQLVAAGGGRPTHRVWDVAGEEYIPLRIWTESPDSLKNIDFSPNGPWLAGATEVRTVIWDSITGAECGSLGTTNANATAFSSDSRSLIVSTADRLVQYPLASAFAGGQTFQTAVPCPLSSNQEPFRAMALAADRKTVAVVQQQEILLASVTTNCPLQTEVLSLNASYRRLALHPRAEWAAACMEDSKSVEVWKVGGQTLERKPVTLPGSTYFAFSDDGKWLATCADGAYHLYSVGSWSNSVRIIRKWDSDQNAPVAFRGSVIAVAASRYTIQLLLLSADGKSAPLPLVTLDGPDDKEPLEMLAFSPDGRQLAAGTANRMVQIWNLARIRDELARANLEGEWPKYE